MVPPGADAAVRVPVEIPAKTAAPSRRVLTPAPKPESVLVPPLVGTLFVTAVVATLDQVSRPSIPVVGSVARALWVVLATAVPASLALTITRARGVGAGWLLAAVVSILGSTLAAVLLPGSGLDVAAFTAAAVLGYAAPLGWRPWKDRWMRARLERVSLLAPSALGAYEAARRLEVVPWVRVASVLVPECEPHLASRLLQRPTAPAVRGGPRLERRVVVSCPMRDALVGKAIAELVARGHAITSESSVMRWAEGRVDSTKADPLNLLLGMPRNPVQNVLSRVLDVVLASLLLVLLSPVLLLAAAAVFVETGFPVFYRQRRVGKGGTPIDVIKFRSMRQDAESASGPVWAEKDDPRVTRVGRLLRKYRIDELPQLFNVLGGSMALVGPRPERPHFCDALRGDVPLFELRTIVRPGITGWAQVRLAYGASSDDARAKLEYDLYYVTRRSPWFDLAILAETARVVLMGQGSR